NSLASSPWRSPLVMPARSTTSNDASVVFFGLNSAVRRSTRGSGTRAIPTCSSRLAPNDDVGTLWPVRRLKSDVLPLLGSPTRPIFMSPHATMPARDVPPLGVRGRGTKAMTPLTVSRYARLAEAERETLVLAHPRTCALVLWWSSGSRDHAPHHRRTGSAEASPAPGDGDGASNPEGARSTAARRRRDVLALQYR